QILKHDPNNEEVQMWFKLFKLTHRMKEDVNEAYKNGLLDDAIDKYTQCIHADPCNHRFNIVVYCNRAAVWIKKAQYQKAFDDCTICIEINPNNVKAFIRRSQAALKLKRYSKATSDTEKACQLDLQCKDSLPFFFCKIILI
ncbi:dnaJ like protein, partial [Reticulomyxa filosa]